MKNEKFLNLTIALSRAIDTWMIDLWKQSRADRKGRNDQGSKVAGCWRAEAGRSRPLFPKSPDGGRITGDFYTRGKGRYSSTEEDLESSMAPIASTKIAQGNLHCVSSYRKRWKRFQGWLGNTAPPRALGIQEWDASIQVTCDTTCEKSNDHIILKSMVKYIIPFRFSDRPGPVTEVPSIDHRNKPLDLKPTKAIKYKFSIDRSIQKIDGIVRNLRRINGDV